MLKMGGLFVRVEDNDYDEDGVMVYFGSPMHGPGALKDMGVVK